MKEFIVDLFFFIDFFVVVFIRVVEYSCAWLFLVLVSLLLSIILWCEYWGLYVYFVFTGIRCYIVGKSVVLYDCGYVF